MFLALFIAQLISYRLSPGFLTIRVKRTACPLSSIRAVKKEVKNNSAEKNPTPAAGRGGPAKSQESFSVFPEFSALRRGIISVAGMYIEPGHAHFYFNRVVGDYFIFVIRRIIEGVLVSGLIGHARVESLYLWPV